ncbi:MAG: cation transporter [Acidobacteria bacterium]|nr:cation transporter [Acidobacteriota bacterium]
MGLAAAVMVVEIVGGMLSNSLALLADAGHVFTDVLALGLAMFAVTVAARPATDRATFGYYRVEILSALANGVLLVLISLGIMWEAYRRFSDPPEVAGSTVMGVALLGLAGNLGGLYLLRGASRRSLNVRGALMHVVGDTLSSLAVVICGALIMATGWKRIDAGLSAFIGAVIIIGAFRLVREAVDVLLEAGPAGIELKSVSADIQEIPGVRQVHDLHIWSITSGMHALSGHVVVEETTLLHCDRILNTIKSLLKERYEIHHTTIQIESEAYREIGEVH